MSKPLILALLAPLVALAACGDDDPGTEPSASTPDAATAGDGGGGGDPVRLFSGDASIADAPIDRDPGYRDPRAGDAACLAPNLLCPTQDPDASPDAGPVCVAVGTDVDNCGACGHQCVGPGATCIASMCACSDLEFDYCADTGCMDVSSDTNNCGACGNVCDPNLYNDCVSGRCVAD
jgi:hypothetical protein